ncbi:hypothetical protein BBJ28_00010600 [Nothophytophthora sp. Chile5]|nr:hypothetical protein BBJ28_00010600 [Nothophytophthora sp. Chile5]
MRRFTGPSRNLQRRLAIRMPSHRVAQSHERPLRFFSAFGTPPASENDGEATSNSGWTGGAVLAYADGASRGNPGRSGCGALLMDPSSREVIATSTRYLGEQETNNTAEYSGLLLALRLAHQHDATHVHIHMDSQLIVRQMLGQYRVKAANLRGLHKQCKELCASLIEVTFSHVRREENAAADRLANKAIDEYEALEQDVVHAEGDLTEITSER